MRRLVLAALGGALMHASYGPHRWWLAVVAWALASATLDHATVRMRLGAAAVFAVAWFAPTVAWIGVLGGDARILLTALCALPWLAVAAVPDLRTKRGGATLAATAVLVEWARSTVPWGGFPWGLVAYSQIDGPLVDWSRLGGDALVTAWVVFLGNALWRTVGHRGHVLAVAAVAASVLLMGDAPASGTVSVAAVQGSVPRLGLDDVTQAQEVFDNHVAETRTLLRTSTRPDIVVWPENAADSDPTTGSGNGSQITRLARSLGRPILVGALVDNGGPRSTYVGPTNSGLLWLPDGRIAGRYDKHHLVPFGEYLPLRAWLAPRIGRFDQIAQDIVAGTSAATITLDRPDGPPVPMGTVICFEVAYDDSLSAAVRQGASVFVVQSNNATYAYSDQPSQQLAITRFRAIEHQRAAVVATTTGDSALINPEGRLVATAPRMVPATLVGDIGTVTTREPVDRTWPLVRWGSLLWCALLCVRKPGRVSG